MTRRRCEGHERPELLALAPLEVVALPLVPEPGAGELKS